MGSSSIVLSILLVWCSTIVFSFPGHLNAHAEDLGLSFVSIEKDVVLSNGNGGHNFNAETDSNAQAMVAVGGNVVGSIVNRTGQEFNAISKNNGSSQVRINGDLKVDNNDKSSKKFDAVSETGGQSLVQVGNVQIISTSNKREMRSPRPESPDANSTSPRLGAAWGAAAVAESNSKPWETVGHDEPQQLEPAHEEPLLPVDPPMTSSPIPTTEIAPVTVTATEIPTSSPSSIDDAVNDLIIHETQDVANNGNGTQVPPTPTFQNPEASTGNLNAISKGHGSKSMVRVKGSVVA